MELSRWLQLLQQGNTPHAVFLTGPEGSGKKGAARRGAALYLLGREDPRGLLECPFYQELPDYSIKTLRDCCQQLNQQAFDRGRRCLVIPDAHKLPVQNQNVLLKTLEEPPAEALLILTGNQQAVLPTIRSRCMPVQVGGMEREALVQLLMEEGVPRQTAQLAAALADGMKDLARTYATEAYMTFRQGCLELFREAVFGSTPFAQAAALLESKPPKDQEPEDEEEGKSRKKRVARETLLGCMDVGLSNLRDALLERLGGGEYMNLDGAALRKKLADHFTTGEIQGMIATTLSTRKVLLSTVEEGKAAGSVLDGWLVALGQWKKGKTV